MLHHCDKQYLACPLCDVDCPISEDMIAGDRIYCIYCESPLKLKKTKKDEFYLEEDF